MEYREFKLLYDKFSKLPMKGDIFKSSDYLRYVEAINDNPKIEEFFLKEELRRKHVNVSKYCCAKLAYYVSMSTAEANAIIKFYKNKVFGIPIADGGNSYIKIKYCPWCGNLLAF